MAIYQGRTGGGDSSTAMFQQINAANQRWREEQQANRAAAFEEELTSAGLLGQIRASSDVEFDDAGHADLGGTALSYQDHLRQAGAINPKSKKVRGALGRGVKRSDLEAYMKGFTDQRDMAILSALEQRMAEVGGDIYSVAPDAGEDGHDEFKAWYHAADDRVKAKLREYGYHPELEDKKYVPDYMDMRRAEGKSIVQGKDAVIGSGIVAGGYLGGKYLKDKAVDKGRTAQRQAYKKSYNMAYKEGEAKVKDGLKSEISKYNAENKKLKTLQGRRTKLKDKISKNKNGKATDSQKKALKELNEKIKAQKKNVSSASYKRKYNARMKRVKIKAQAGARKAASSSTITRSESLKSLKSGLRFMGKSMAGGEVGGLIGDALGGETGEAIGTLGGQLTGPALFNKLASGVSKTGTGKKLAMALAKKLPQVAIMSAADGVLPIGEVAGLLMLAKTAYDVVSDD